MSDLISRQAAIEAIDELVSTRSVCVSMEECMGMNGMKRRAIAAIRELPTIDHAYGFPLEHLALIARVMEKEGATPEEVAELLQYAGKISGMVVDVMQTIREAVRRIDDDPSHPFADGVMMKE